MFLSSPHCEKSVSGLIIETLFFFSRCELFLLLIEFLFPDSLNGKIFFFFFNAWLIMMIIFLDDSYLKSYFFLIKEDHLVIFNCCVFIQEKMPINFESLIKHIKYIRGHPSKCESRIHAT